MQQLLVLLLAGFLLGGCATVERTSRIEVSGDGQGTIGLAKLAIEIQRAKAKLMCPDGVLVEERKVLLTTVPPDTDSWEYRRKLYRPEPRVLVETTFTCK